MKTKKFHFKKKIFFFFFELQINDKKIFKKTIMQFQYLSELGKEFKKYTGFMVPEAVRQPSIEASSLLQSEEIALPIDSASSPIVVAFTNILNNAKTSKTSSPIVSTMCNVLSAEIFQGEALTEILTILEDFSPKIEIESGLKIIQIATMLVNSHFLEIKIFNSILSLVLSLCISSIEFVTNNAKAAFEQILAAFFAYSSTITELNSMISADIDSVFSLYSNKEENLKFEHEIDKLSYVIISDIASICITGKSNWLNSHGLKKSVAYEFMEAIFIQQKELISKNQAFLSILSKVLHASTKGKNTQLSFPVNIIDMYMEFIPADCLNVFTYYLEMINKDNPHLVKGLMFFRYLIFKDQSIIVNFYRYCDKTGDIIQLLVNDLLKLFEDQNIPAESDLHISFIAKPTTSASPSLGSLNSTPTLSPSHSSSFISAAPSTSIEKCSSIEIAAFIVRGLFKANSQDLSPLVQKIWADLLSILTQALHCIDQSSAYILLQSLHFFIVLANDLQMDDPRGSAISAIVNVIGESVSAYSEQMRLTAVDTVSAAIEGSPLVFNGHWSKIINALSLYNTELTDLSFSLQMPISHLTELAQALLSVRTASTGDTRQWALDFSLALLNVNSQRINELWPQIEEQYNDGQIDTIEGFMGLFHDIISEDTEESLCPTLITIMQTKDLPLETRMNLIDNIYTIISEESTNIKKGWPSIIKSISPDNFDDSPELINNAFRCLQILCTDILFSLGQEDQMLAFSLIFEFTSQKADINISLSALGLLWNIVSLAKTNELWISILGNTIKVIQDDRPDISLCAVKTLFSLVMSNCQNLNEEVFDFLRDQFSLLHADSGKAISNADFATQQLAIYETVHCVHTLFNYFHNLTNDFWRALVKSQQRFMEQCNKRDSTCAGFLFYEEIFAMDIDDDVRMFIFDTLDNLAEIYLKRESPNCVIFGTFGRMIRNVLPNQKNRGPEEFQRWINLSEKLIFEMDCADFLPPTVHKTFDAIDEVFPNTDEVTKILLNHLVKCAAYTQNERLSEVAIEHITDISSNRIPDSQLPMVFVLSEPLFKLPLAKQLLLNFVDRDIDVQNDVELFCSTLIELSKDEGDVAERASINVLKLFKHVSNETKKTFIEIRKNHIKTMEQVWERFLDPNSEEFDQETSTNFCKTVLEAFGDDIRNSDNDEHLIEALSFLEKAKISKDIFPQYTNVSPHLLFLMPSLADLVMHPSEEVRRTIRSVLLKVTDV